MGDFYSQPLNFHGGPQGAKPKAEVIAQILADVKEQKA